MENEEKNKQYLIAGSIGFLLILLVGLATIVRSDLSEKNNLADINQSDSIEEIYQPDEKAVSAEELMKKIIRKESLTVLDIRSEEEYKKEHLMDSINIPLVNFLERVSSLAADRTYIIMDVNDSQAALLAINILEENKISDTFYLKGGFLAWKAQYNPTISSGDPNSFVDQAKVKYIKSDKLKELIAQDPRLFIIDVRDAEVFQAGHIKGAVNIFLENLEKEKAQIPLGRKIVLYDNDGLWAFMGAVRLYDMGFFNVLSLSDGLDGWKNNKLEVVK